MTAQWIQIQLSSVVYMPACVGSIVEQAKFWNPTCTSFAPQNIGYVALSLCCLSYMLHPKSYPLRTKTPQLEGPCGHDLFKSREVHGPGKGPRLQLQDKSLTGGEVLNQLNATCLENTFRDIVLIAVLLDALESYNKTVHTILCQTWLSLGAANARNFPMWAMSFWF